MTHNTICACGEQAWHIWQGEDGVTFVCDGCWETLLHEDEVNDVLWSLYADILDGWQETGELDGWGRDDDDEL